MSVVLSFEISFKRLISTMTKFSTMYSFTKLIMTNSILRIRKLKYSMSFLDKSKEN